MKSRPIIVLLIITTLTSGCSMFSYFNSREFKEHTCIDDSGMMWHKGEPMYRVEEYSSTNSPSTARIKSLGKVTPNKTSAPYQ